VALSLGAGLTWPDGPVSAQRTLPPDLCRGALSIAESIKTRYDISQRLAASFQKFDASDCDIDTPFERDTELDVRAFVEFQLRFQVWRTCADNPLSPACK
jgi:hypothetical protein